MYASGFEPVLRWHGGTKQADGSYSLPYPEYHPLAEQFFRQVAAGPWLDYGYRPEEAARLLSDPALVQAAALPQLKTMLTYCLRGERFADGHWEEMIVQGHVRRILERLAEIGGSSQDEPEYRS